MNNTIAIITNKLDGMAAMYAAGITTMGKTKGEKDTEFVKRIVAAYLYAEMQLRDKSLVEVLTELSR